MRSGFRNFLLTFSISLVIFGVIFYFLVGMASDMINGTVPAGADVETTPGAIVAPVDTAGQTESETEEEKEIQ